jgi:Sulfotransferase family
MPSLVLSDTLIWFAHCPKAGGTSVERLMVETWGSAVGHLHWGWDKWWKAGGWRHADPPNSPQHLIWSDALQTLPRAPDHVFALVRHPVERIASEYRYQRRHRRGTFLGRTLAFLPFSVWLMLMLAVAKRNPHAFDNHLRPQSDFIPKQAEVFRLEQGLQQVADWLESISGNTGLTVSSRELMTRKNTSINAKDIARIEVAFGADFERFGYPSVGSPPPRRGLGDRVVEIAAPLVAKMDRRGRL